MEEKAEKYPIKDIERSFRLLQQLEPENDSTTFIKIIVGNLIRQGKEPMAIDFCTKILRKMNLDGEAVSVKKGITLLRRRTISSQIGKMILEQINTTKPEISDEAFLESLEQKMKEHLIQPEDIIISTNPYNSKPIMLSEVWYDKDLTTKGQKLAKRKKEVAL